MTLSELSDTDIDKHAPISCHSIPSSHCSLAVEMLMVSVGLLFTTIIDALDRRPSVRLTTICRERKLYIDTQDNINRIISINTTSKSVRAANQHITVISEGSCDTEDMMLKIQLFHHTNKLHFKMYYDRKQSHLQESDKNTSLPSLFDSNIRTLYSNSILKTKILFFLFIIQLAKKASNTSLLYSFSILCVLFVLYKKKKKKKNLATCKLTCKLTETCYSTCISLLSCGF